MDPVSNHDPRGSGILGFNLVAVSDRSGRSDSGSVASPERKVVPEPVFSTDARLHRDGRRHRRDLRGLPREQGPC